MWPPIGFEAEINEDNWEIHQVTSGDLHKIYKATAKEFFYERLQLMFSVMKIQCNTSISFKSKGMCTKPKGGKIMWIKLIKINESQPGGRFKYQAND